MMFIKCSLFEVKFNVANVTVMESAVVFVFHLFLIIFIIYIFLVQYYS